MSNCEQNIQLNIP